MKVTLISVYENITAYGMRSLAAVLKSSGFETQMIFLPRETEGHRWEGFRYAYPGAVLEQIGDLAADSDLIGITLMSNYFDNAVQITEHLHHATNAPIVWGGIHPTIRPEECLEYADVVCVGEGEDALRELAQQMATNLGYEGIDNMWYKRNGEIIRTALRPLPHNLDQFPYPDYDLETEYVLHKGRIQPMTDALLLYYLTWPYGSEEEPMYATMMSRGCTCSCTYCCNNALRQTYLNRWHVRRRSVPNFVGELVEITTRFPGIKWIKIEDDVFLDDPEVTRQFAEAYKQALDLPLFIPGFQPWMVREDIVSVLVSAGMKRVRVGIQSGSVQVLHRVYHRPGTIEQIAQAAAVLHKFTDLIEPPWYDLIVDNPWETEQDQIKTLHVLLDLPKPYRLVLFSLTFYPGTELYERAVREGIITDDLNQIYRKNYLVSKQTYLNGLFRLFELRIAPRWLMSLLLQERAQRLNWVWLPYFLARCFRGILLIEAGWQSVVSGDLMAFVRAFRARTGTRQQSRMYGEETACFRTKK
jgi:anaerobic magnesium-protoporphyrin IX monomethyl ester cyclase